MSTAAGAPSNGETTGVTSPERQNKGKGKNPAASPDVSMEEGSEESEEDEEDEEMEEYYDDGDDSEADDDDDDEAKAVVDSSAIISGRRTRGIRVDYTSEEALRKAGLAPEGEDSEDEEKW